MYDGANFSVTFNKLLNIVFMEQHIYILLNKSTIMMET